MLDPESYREGVHWRELSYIGEPRICYLLSGEHEGSEPYNENPRIAPRFLTWIKDRTVLFGEY